MCLRFTVGVCIIVAKCRLALVRQGESLHLGASPGNKSRGSALRGEESAVGPGALKLSIGDRI